ncbi:uncharacterized protein [Typha latifolia]|uniref:uncharacterized protein n=1 Tax=Typha latifolia TaxID=4733 RepID=UPI003C2F21C7
MGKPGDLELAVPNTEVGVGGAGGGSAGFFLWPCSSWIGKVFTFKCVLVLLLSVGVFLSALFWLPPFYSLRSRFVSDDPVTLSAEIQASFILQRPVSWLAAHTGKLEYDIYVEIGIPNSKVSVISMHSLAPENSTYVVFGVLPNSKYASISSPALSVLRSSLIELVLQQLNLSLTPSLFGYPSSFEILKFPGGVTVIPVQSASIWETTQILFNFTLNNSIDQVLRNLDKLKDQLKFGLNLRSHENVYVQMTNENGSTVVPQLTVQASVLSDVGSGSLLPYRLKQLAQVITGPETKNLGLNHSIFGKVKSVQLSSYLQYSISSPAPGPSPSPSLSPSPSPSPMPFEDTPYATPPISFESPLSSYAPSPLVNQHHQPPCSCCHALPPFKSSSSYSLSAGNGACAPSPFMNTPGPSETSIGSSQKHGPDLSPLPPVNSLPENYPHQPTSPSHSPIATSTPVLRPLGPTSKMTP